MSALSIENPAAILNELRAARREHDLQRDKLLLEASTIKNADTQSACYETCPSWTLYQNAADRLFRLRQLYNV